MLNRVVDAFKEYKEYYILLILDLIASIILIAYDYVVKDVINAFGIFTAIFTLVAIIVLLLVHAIYFY